MAARRVVIVVRNDCHLCADAVATAERVCTELDVPLELLNVDHDPALAEHSDHVPVTFVDDARLAIWWLDEARLREALTR